MLVLSRRIGEVVEVGEDISIIICDVQGERVRLGIKAPIGTPVHRQEVADRIREERQAAATDRRCR